MTMMTRTSPAVALENSRDSDAEIIQQVLAGNTALFELLMRRYNERIYRAARSIVRDEQEAEDIMQQAYVNAFTHLRQFNGSAQFSTWLTRIAINEALARVRRRGRYEAFDDDLSNVEPLMSTNPYRIPSVRRSQGSFEDSWSGPSIHCRTACARYSCCVTSRG
jgi:DNA-directed RNA polymerase specialized sigma24 family protein